MSPASKSKSKDKKAGKDSQKASSKPSVSASAGSGVPASAYNPSSGTFLTLETLPSASSSPLQNNGRFRNIDETDDHSGSSHGAGVEYDSVSNNGSWSGESEDHKEKTSNLPARHEAIPGVDSDKREKIRQKNERKHQRQKERRAQELHEKCSGYLMSRKLEGLAQQLVAMGFSHERATMALMLNEGKVEESVAWLFEEAEEADKHRESTIGGVNLKIDISEELAKIAELEIRYKCTKQEVERQVVAAEGDLQKAAEGLKAMKLDPPSATPKPEETGDPSSNGKISVGTGQGMTVRPYPKLNPSSATQQRRDEKDFNYTKTTVTVGGPPEPAVKNLQPLKRIQPKADWAKPQQTVVQAEKRWPNAGPNTSLSYPVSSTPQASPTPAKSETRYMAAGSEFKSLQPTVREPVIMMQRPQSINTKQIPATSVSSSPPAASSWFPTSSVETMKSNGFMTHAPSSRSLSPNNLSSNQMYQQFHYQPQQHFAPSALPGDSPGTNRGNSLWNRTGTSPTLAAASSLGLFSGLGSTGSSGANSPIDWSTGGSMTGLDYASIDWSLDRGLSSPRTAGLWMGPTSSLRNTHLYDSNTNMLGVKPATRSTMPMMGLHDGGVAPADTSAAGSHEWTSPFEGNDLFTLPRQFVSSPSL